MHKIIITTPMPTLRSGEVVYRFEEAPAECFKTRREALHYRDQHNSQMLRNEEAGTLP